MDLGWLQARVADEIGVDETTICNWETNRSQAAVRKIPGIIRFLGYTPYRVPVNFGDWLHQVRTSWGLSEEAGANLLCVDETTLAKWERGVQHPTPRSLWKVQRAFGSVPSTA
jgi:transcriptional regulator with XRE-family HTH domain